MLFDNWPQLPLGRIGAIPVRLAASFVLVPLLLLWGLPLRFIVENWLLLAAAVAGVFLSILLHELGHAGVAKHHRAGVKEIVVGGFYGYARLHTQAIPRTILIRILAAGPAVNLIIFIVLWLGLSAPLSADPGVGGLAAREGSPSLWPAAVWWLAKVNLVMFAFNAVPAYPLDGGRILGLILDRRVSGNFSAQIVSGVSILAGAVMILLGLGANALLAVIGVLVLVLNLGRVRRLRRRASKTRGKTNE